MPRFFAALTDLKLSSIADSEIAGVMPVMWNRPLTPSNALFQSISPGFASAIEEYARS